MSGVKKSVLFTMLIFIIIAALLTSACASLDLQAKGLSAVAVTDITSVSLVFETADMNYLSDNRLIMNVILKGSDKPITLPSLFDVELSSPDGSATFPGRDTVRSSSFHAHQRTTVVARHPNLPNGEIVVTARNRWQDSYRLDFSGRDGQKAGQTGSDGANLKIEAAEINAEGFVNSPGPIMVMLRIFDQARGTESYVLFPRNARVQIVANGGNGKPGANGMDSGMLRSKAYANQPDFYEGGAGQNGGDGGNGGNIEFNFGQKGLDRMFVFQVQGGQGGKGGQGGIGARKYRDSSGGYYYNVGPNGPSGQFGSRGQPGQVRTLLLPPSQLFAGIESSQWMEFQSRIRSEQ